ncbi:MAG TPA: geranylgeranylglyceryl/heptaprenylglyceryl phosphate synthase [bacterium]|nr:geranylgeranylglyceryl/heptaprenylglyceryl phosphate synthase [bacterium]HNT64633.1 geranylgeranylglyceryl/heptaprenylglyceryl phosphate synthase [bacterium]HOX85793.1 geranylgeranylglyceryl/heptaprenylglyceryl phosphate synthase [bacterium]HPG45224.1 geranylgeranylglyceryl/heptaprenylglyceryl phosphate synthase [bacterium]HPM97466.1 geranylgeranylglyceryl/heptaprenylglyceryl phosphate synthase [bacterium]
MHVFDKLLRIKEQKGAGYLVLIDPDKQGLERAVEIAQKCQENEVDALLVGGSLLFAYLFDELIKGIKAVCELPVIIFPGGTRQISPYADAILFLSVISGRNANQLIGEQVVAAPIIKSMNLEAISTGYMFIESGSVTSAQFLNGSLPIPREKPDMAMAHALAAEYLGMKCVYLEAGSGAKYAVPVEMIATLNRYVEIPMIIGGGIRSPEAARERVEAGASFIVTGNVLEKNPDTQLIRSFAQAVHWRQNSA